MQPSELDAHLEALGFRVLTHLPGKNGRVTAAQVALTFGSDTALAAQDIFRLGLAHPSQHTTEREAVGDAALVG